MLTINDLEKNQSFHLHTDRVNWLWTIANPVCGHCKLWMKTSCPLEKIKQPSCNCAACSQYQPTELAVVALKEFKQEAFKLLEDSKER